MQQLPVKSTRHTRVDDVPNLYLERDLPGSAGQTALVHQKKLWEHLISTIQGSHARERLPFLLTRPLQQLTSSKPSATPTPDSPNMYTCQEVCLIVLDFTCLDKKAFHKVKINLSTLNIAGLVLLGNALFVASQYVEAKELTRSKPYQRSLRRQQLPNR